MLSKLRRWWSSTDPSRRNLDDPQDVSGDLVTEDQADVDPSGATAFLEFANYLLKVSAVSSPERTTVLRQIKSSASSNGSDNLELFVMNFCNDCPIDQLLCIRIDWKAWDEIDGQLEHIAERHKLSLDGKPQWGSDGSTTDEVVREIATWLQPKGFYFIDIETGSDDCLLLLVPHDDNKILKLAVSAGLPAKAIL